ncbi:Flagellar biosynthetic protein FlhB [Fundidesulfovibrio magnetotacticus]|uniref:Flagellar biosynthetic protein FlhB n=1 Tax=Fundidesulfovibrio magnetotacticus TaxID=2730080 RepID=A0A6V8LIH2_9BACT|nr:flagellar type III secretion system protein FlhB [Fundidesulfovibrio magnetotacticus]GFK92542.1 Flagellar biosynthetic protein FlhB [Fundidesulfovibrio magnetotacticus]
MAERDPSKTERATPKRRNEARDKGSVPKSQELPKMLVLLAGMVASSMAIGVYERELRDIFRFFLSEGLRMEVTLNTAHNLLLELSWRLAKMLLPTFLLLAGTAYVVMRIQVGQIWVLPWQNFQWSQFFNPMAGVQKLLLDKQTLIRLGKQVLMALAIGIAPYIVLKREFGNMLPLFYTDAYGMAAFILSNAMSMLWYTMLPMVIIAAADTWYTRWDYEENLKMTKSEVKDERRNVEGDPEVKQQQRQKMFQVMGKRMLKNVPKADVVITNPTHIAVALQYNPLFAPAPIVLAKGADHLAQKIKEIARENGVPIRENVPLARALYKEADVGETIPEALFQAVAAVLAQLDKFRNRGR